MSISDHRNADVDHHHSAELSALSPREFDIFRMLGQGCSNREISKALNIAERTVKAHITNVLTKLRLESRLQAGLRAQSLGVSHFEHHRDRLPKGPMAGIADGAEDSAAVARP